MAHGSVTNTVFASIRSSTSMRDLSEIRSRRFFNIQRTLSENAGEGDPWGPGVGLAPAAPISMIDRFMIDSRSDAASLLAWGCREACGVVHELDSSALQM